MLDITTRGADEYIDKLAKKYLGQDRDPWSSPDATRVILLIEPTKLHESGLSD